ncbi:MAG: hypothetical protein RLZZ70_207 [Candidatus Parcubacteria bacterium]|jgi:hypothetical protein
MIFEFFFNMLSRLQNWYRPELTDEQILATIENARETMIPVSVGPYTILSGVAVYYPDHRIDAQMLLHQLRRLCARQLVRLEQDSSGNWVCARIDVPQ